MKKILAFFVGLVVAIVLSAILIFVCGNCTKITVFGADFTLIFFESFLINITSCLAVEGLLESEIGDAVVDLFISAICSIALVFITWFFKLNWLSQLHLLKSASGYLITALVAVLIAANLSVTVGKK